MMVLGVVTALADGRTAPDDKKIITDDASGLTSSFRKYDNKYWDAASEQPGTVVKMEYTTDVYGDTVTNWLQVYVLILPMNVPVEKKILAHSKRQNCVLINVNKQRFLRSYVIKGTRKAVDHCNVMNSLQSTVFAFR